jgi:hypothetical protein
MKTIDRNEYANLIVGACRVLGGREHLGVAKKIVDTRLGQASITVLGANVATKARKFVVKEIAKGALSEAAKPFRAAGKAAVSPLTKLVMKPFQRRKGDSVEVDPYVSPDEYEDDDESGCGSEEERALAAEGSAEKQHAARVSGSSFVGSSISNETYRAAILQRAYKASGGMKPSTANILAAEKSVRRDMVRNGIVLNLRGARPARSTR